MIYPNQYKEGFNYSDGENSAQNLKQPFNKDMNMVAANAFR